MLLGIDVGGTFTDAVVVDGGRVVAQAKAPTTAGDLLEGILAALDGVLVGLDTAALERVAGQPRLSRDLTEVTAQGLK